MTGRDQRRDGAAAGRRLDGPAHLAGRGRWYPWVVMGVVLAGSYLVVLNTTVLGVALPDISRDLGSGARLDADWVITSYLLAVVGVQPATAWLADRLGHKRLYLGCLSGFALGSVLCAVAPTMEALLAARFVQGAGGGALMPLGMAMVLDVFPPHRRGFVLGIRGVAIMAGPALGPPIGGIIVTQASWRWIFGALVPIAVLAVVLAARLLHDPGHRAHRPLDKGGWVLAFLGIGMIVVAARQAADWGFTAPATWSTFLVGTGLLVLLGWRSRRRRHPIIEPRLFTVPLYALSLVMVWLITVVLYARLNFLPVELQVVRGLPAQQVGFILVPSALGLAVTMAMGGWLADRIGARVPTMVGLSVLSLTTWQLATLEPTTAVWWIVTVLLLQGLGSGLMRIPVNVTGMNALDNRDITQGAALRSLNRQVAGALAVAVLAGILTLQLGSIAPEVTTASEVAAAQAAYNSLFKVAFVFVLLALCASVLMPGRGRMQQLQDLRAREYARDHVRDSGS
jgi:EmrB/QacA subfamily drug resistance transporter